jgi:hypothetical protein
LDESSFLAVRDEGRNSAGPRECAPLDAVDLEIDEAPVTLHPTLLGSYLCVDFVGGGVSPVYVQEQLGHATIELTVSTYDRWLKKKAPGAVHRVCLPLVSRRGRVILSRKHKPILQLNPLIVYQRVNDLPRHLTRRTLGS